MADIFEERLKKVLALPYGRESLRRIESTLKGRVIPMEEVKRRNLKIWSGDDPDLPLELHQDQIVWRILEGLDIDTGAKLK